MSSSIRLHGVFFVLPCVGSSLIHSTALIPLSKGQDFCEIPYPHALAGHRAGRRGRVRDHRRPRPLGAVTYTGASLWATGLFDTGNNNMALLQHN